MKNLTLNITSAHYQSALAAVDGCYYNDQEELRNHAFAEPYECVIAQAFKAAGYNKVAVSSRILSTGGGKFYNIPEKLSDGLDNWLKTGEELTGTFEFELIKGVTFWHCADGYDMDKNSKINQKHKHHDPLR